jgi:hypothetical protein
MAGRIVFKAGTWNCSGGSFRAMAEGVAAQLESDEPSIAVRSVLDEAIASNVMFIDFDGDLQPAARAAYSTALQRYRDQLSASGPVALANPALFDGHVERMQELSKLINQAMSAA